MAKNTSVYVLTHGKHWRTNAKGVHERMKVGDAIEHTPEQAAAFGDRFKAASVVAAEAKVASEMSKAAEAEAAKVKAEAEASSKTAAAGTGTPGTTANPPATPPPPKP